MGTFKKIIALGALAMFSCFGTGYTSPDTKSEVVQQNYSITELDNVKGYKQLKKDAKGVKAIYIDRKRSKSPKSLDSMISSMKKSGFNSAVIDFKDDYGSLRYNSTNARARLMKAVKGDLGNAFKLISKLHDKDVYVIGRVVAFKDAHQRLYFPSLAPKKCNSKTAWIDPFSRDVWEYTVSISEELARAGIDEIQFDYVRFGPCSSSKNYRTWNGRESRADAIAGFLKYARERLDKYDVNIGIDIFGVVTVYNNDQGIGQYLERVSKDVDVICPMVYPGKWGKHWWGKPYEIVKRSIGKSRERLDKVGLKNVVIRPYLQAFKHHSPGYGPKYILKQIRGSNDAGGDGFLFWNLGRGYDILFKALKK